MCGGGGGGDGGYAASEAERQAKIKEGYNKIQDIFSGFDDNFYNNRATAYTNYAKPQLDDQYSKAIENLTYALARNNRLDSSVAGEQQAELQKQYDDAMTNLTSSGLDYANSSRDAVNQARTNLVTINNSVADPDQIAAESATTAAGLKAADAYDPIGTFFTNIGETLATQGDLERRQNARFNTGLFTPSATSGSGSARYVS